MSTPSFQFQRFSISHEHCAMKVGTDGVLLGAWCPLVDREEARVLDVGTGCGLIALMLAQRYSDRLTNFHIDAIDIDAPAAAQAADNFTASPWATHLQSHTCALQDWATHQPYDLIVSNPPFFENSLRCPDPTRSIARHTDDLDFETLLSRASLLLAQEGICSLILPYTAEQQVTTMAAHYHLYPTHILHVAGKKGKSNKRSLIAFRFYQSGNPPIPAIRELYLSTDDAPRSREYSELTKDFYQAVPCMRK